MVLTLLVEHPISIHPPREGWDLKKMYDQIASGISIHPPREGWDF